MKLTSFFSQRGIRGYVTFEQKSPESEVVINVDLQSAFVTPIRLSWEVREFPVDYRKEMEERCLESEIGTSVLNLGQLVGELNLPDNASERLTTNKFSLTGKNGIWGRSLLMSFIEGEPDNVVQQLAGCATITVDGDFEERVAEVRFYYPLAGSIWFRWLGSSSIVDSVIYNEGLFHVSENLDKMSGKHKSRSLPTKHGWQVFASDILDSEADKSRANCNFLQILFDPDSRDDSNCSEDNSGSCKAGDLTSKLGKITVQPNPALKPSAAASAKKLFRDPHFPMPTEISANAAVATRSLYVVLYDPQHEDSFLACARLRRHHPRIVQANAPGLPRVRLTQYSPFEPTRMDVNATSAMVTNTLSSEDVHLKIHEFPVPPLSGLGAVNFKTKNSSGVDPRCNEVGYIFEPKINPPKESPYPRPGGGTQDRYFLGDLGGKHGFFHVGIGTGPRTMWDAYLPLHGKYSVAQRALVAHKITNDEENVEGEAIACAPLVPEEPVITAVAQFQYPAVGRVLFRQINGDPLADTAVIVEYLTYTDGTKNDTDGHRWALSESPIGRDFYNWSERCVSAGPRNNPFKVPLNSNDKGKEPGDCQNINFGSALICAQGDLSGRHGTLKVTATRKNLVITKKFFSDSHLPLEGANSIIGHSVVLYDDFGPKARGERLGCATIGWHHRLKAVAKDWFGSGEGGGGTVSPVHGKVEMIQQSEYDDTDVEVTLDGLDGEERGYYIHEASVEIYQEFPCEESSLYGTWDPFTAQQNHAKREYLAIGDLSGKHGSLDGLEKTTFAYNDTQLPLYGVYSVIGRSVIIHRGKMARRWSCSTIERGYSPSEARELRAIASFHHPKGFAYGYIRMKQLIYNDGSRSDTAIEVKLRHPGKNDRNFTQNHNWAIFVNPVGQDAAVPTYNTRCVAGGYRWNPYYNQLADPLNDELYRAECGQDNPLRCDVGDISGRLGPIHLGGRRQLFNDVNLPLEGTVSAIGRSIVIYNKEGRSERFACANIEPDKDIIKYANIRKPPRFVTAQFIDDVREVMGLPEWMLTVDSRKTKVLHGGGCIQFLLHFKGPIANQLEQDFSRLMSVGKLERPSLYIPGAHPSSKRKSQLAYRPCGTRDPNEKSSKKFGSQNLCCSLSPSNIIISFAVLISFLLFIH
ncbi:hypothetical protein J437_LFUL004250 [Ladona fulva]|uniref:Superoxide dismutase copper/zinc binding domain-containing protein n=1 Tax=Ladona fulva TaxID=123851 RepID=A0A8K0JZJ1_LADFU|nr:hypothetical protein J437_LFUL004250 [Ladona fulva]